MWGVLKRYIEALEAAVVYALVLNMKLSGTSGPIGNFDTDTQRSNRSLDGIDSVEVLAELTHAEHLHPTGVKVMHARHPFDVLAVHQLV